MKDNKVFDELTRKYMPASDAADTVGGEILRAVNRLIYRFYNDGDRLGEGYGCRTCNFAARYLINIDKAYKLYINAVWDCDSGYSEGVSKRAYESFLDLLVNYTVKKLTKTDTDLLTKRNRDDMWDYYDEEIDSYDDDDDDYF